MRTRGMCHVNCAKGGVQIIALSANICLRPSLQRGIIKFLSFITVGQTYCSSGKRKARINKVLYTGNEVGKVTPRTRLVTLGILKGSKKKRARQIVHNLR